MRKAASGSDSFVVTRRQAFACVAVLFATMLSLSAISHRLGHTSGFRAAQLSLSINSHLANAASAAGGGISSSQRSEIAPNVITTGEGNPCGEIASRHGACVAPCQRRTKAGHCVSEMLRLYDEAYAPLWPARVDLLVRSHVSDAYFLIEVLFRSIEQMWPRGIGDVILVLDEGESVVRDLVPPWVKVYYEKNYLDLPGKILQQWSYLWADNYTTAPYIAIIDDDVVFNLKVTPGLLFNLTDSKPIVIGSRNAQRNNWLPSTRWLVGQHAYFANFMVQLPFLFPRAVLPRFREHVGVLHRDKFGKSFDKAFKYFAERGPKFERTQIAHTTLGNYMWAFTQDEVHWALEWTNHIPIPRVGVHIPYSWPFREATNHTDNMPRVIKAYISVSGYFAHEAICHAFPPGELGGCNDVNYTLQQQIWHPVVANLTLVLAPPPRSSKRTVRCSNSRGQIVLHAPIQQPIAPLTALHIYRLPQQASQQPVTQGPHGARCLAAKGPSSAEAFHTFTLDSGASHCFFRDCTTLTPLAAPVPVSLADPTGGPVVARASTVLLCPAVPSGSLSGLHLPTFSTNLVSNAAIQDVCVDTFIPGGQRVAISSCSCRVLSHQTLLWHHRLGHPSLPRLRSMHSRLLVFGLPRSLPSLPPSPAPPCLPCIEGRQRATPHSSEFPPTTAPLQTLHMDVWGPASVGGTDKERYFLLLRDQFSRDFPILRLHSDRGGGFSSDLLAEFCEDEGIRQSFTLPASPQKNGIAEPQPLAPCRFARDLAHTPLDGTGWGMSVFWVWGALSLVHDTTASKLSPRTLRCVFLGFPTDAPPWQFYHPRSCRVFSSSDVTFDESVFYYRLHPHASHPVPLAPLFLVPVPPPVDPLPPQGPAPSGAKAEGEGSGGAVIGGAGSGGADSGGAASPGGGGESSPAGVGATSPGGAGGTAGGTRGVAGAGGTGGAGAGGAGATGPGGPTSARGSGGARGTTSAEGTGAVGAGGTGAVSAVGAAGAGGAGATTAGGTGGPTGTGGTGPTGALNHLLALPPAPTEFPDAGTTPPLLFPQILPHSPLPAPSPYTAVTESLTERREPETRASTPERREPETRASVRARLPRVRRSHAPASSLPAGADPPSDLARASNPTVTRFLAAVVTDSTLSSPTASAFVAELVDFAAAYRLDYRASLVSDPDPACPPSVRGEVALGCDVIEDRHEELE
ncbi:unnamed protein product [Closterium sp. NIES-53]